ncbi:MAG: DUF4062 domain-containing protein [Rubrivivax sp.]|nr:DUF4062 domain-containing protein [Rubrivivax sp.]
MTPKVFISSTSQDLASYRRVAIDECVRAGLMPLVMEFFEAMSLGATAGSRRKLDEAHLYVGIFAHRHGYVEAGESASVTECEFAHAGERGIDRLCFLAEPGHALPVQPESAEQAAAQQNFRRRVETRLIRAMFTTPQDLGIKLAHALLAWKQGDAKARWPQPRLDVQPSAAGPAARWTYRARERRFVGRAEAWSRLQRLCDADSLAAWQVVCGPGGTGKSRLAQEFCLALGQGWRAGFVTARQVFDWTAWQPNADSLLVLDYAAERLEEAQAILAAMSSHGAPGHKLRLLLIERDSEGDWLRQVAGHRSGASASHALRHGEPPVVLLPLSDDECWALAVEAAQAQQLRLPPRAVWLSQLHRLDPERRPLFVALAVDALAAGRGIAHGDSASLLHDLIARERQAWAARGIGPAYQNLLVLATACGGLPEDALAAPAEPGWELPVDQSFDAESYAAMGPGRRADGSLAPLTPDLIGEFLVLESLRGRSARITAARAQALVHAAWRRCGGASRQKIGSVASYEYASPWALFVSRCLDDFPLHDCTRSLLQPPPADAEGRRWWPRMVSQAVHRYAALGQLQTAQSLLADLLAADHADSAEAGTAALRAGLYLLPALAAAGQMDAASALLAQSVARAEPGNEAKVDFIEAAAITVGMLCRADHTALAQAVVQQQGELLARLGMGHPPRVAYAQSLSWLVRTRSLGLAAREAAYAALRAFCQVHAEDDVSTFVELALAAEALCDDYSMPPVCEADAIRMNSTIRSLMHLRERTKIVARDPRDFWSMEVVTDDIRTIRLALARSNISVVSIHTKARRHAEASWVLRESSVLNRPFGLDADFARAWAAAVSMHALALAEQDEFEAVPKAVAAIAAVVDQFVSEADGFLRLASSLARTGLSRAAARANAAAAEAIFEALHALAQQPQATDETRADIAEGALCLLTTPDLIETRDTQRRIARDAAAAMRSPVFLQRLHQRARPGDDIAGVLDFIDSLRDDQA